MLSAVATATTSSAARSGADGSTYAPNTAAAAPADAHLPTRNATPASRPAPGHSRAEP